MLGESRPLCQLVVSVPADGKLKVRGGLPDESLHHAPSAIQPRITCENTTGIANPGKSPQPLYIRRPVHYRPEGGGV
jgi:hypothetical protein